MRNILPKGELVLRIAAGSFFIVTVMAAPYALAHDAAAQRIKQLEERLQAIQMELQKVKSETAQTVQKVNVIEQTTSQTVQKVNTIQQSNSAMETRIAPALDRVEQKSHMLFFRGGFTHMMNQRNGSSIQSNVAPVGAQDQADKNGWYVGAGFDWNLTRDAWGALPKTAVFAELMFEYKQFSNNVQGNGGLTNIPTMLAGGALNPGSVTVSQFTLTAAPKIKFMEGSKVRPWIIPAGLAIHVMSPTSEAVTYLAPGVMFGAGVDYNIWKDFFVGIDGRYHLTPKSDGVDLSGMTAGGYLGIGF